MSLLELILVILVIALLGGFAFNVAGGLIHILLVVALVVFIINMIRRNQM